MKGQGLGAVAGRQHPGHGQPQLFGGGGAASAGGTGWTTRCAGDCAVVISNSGRSRDLLDAAEIARKKGATTIIITASGSPLAHASAGTQHVLLAANHPEDYDRYSPMVSRLLHLMIIDILATCVALRIGSDKLQPLLREMKNNLRNKRYA